jgi:hypothetical protein
MMKKFPKEIEDFANAFVAMQTKRHDADYSPQALFVKSDVQTDIDTVENVIRSFRTAHVRDRRAFCAYVLLRNRSS